MSKKSKHKPQAAPREPLAVIGELTGNTEFMQRMQPEIERLQREQESYYANLREELYNSDFFEDITRDALIALATVSAEEGHRDSLIAIVEGEDFRQSLVRDFAVVYTAIAKDLMEADERNKLAEEDRRIRQEGTKTLYALINEYLDQAIASVINSHEGPTVSPLATIVRNDGYLEIPTLQVIQAAFSAIDHAETGEGWDDFDGARAPTHTTITGKKSTEPGAIYVSLRGADGGSTPEPAALAELWAQVRELDDLTSDVLLACLAACVTKNGIAWVNVDAILDARGIKRIQKRGEPGNWQHGHRTEDRIAVGRALAQLDSLWVEVQNVAVTQPGKRRKAQRLTVESRALAMLDRVMQRDLAGGSVIRAARIALGGWAESYKDLGITQLGLLAQKALEYDPYRHQPEKRLTKYLAFQYRINARTVTIRRTVRDLLGAAAIPPDETRPMRARQRLEKALTQLHKDGVIQQWRPVLDLNTLPARAWLEPWLDSLIEIESPEIVQNRYTTLRALPGGKKRASAG